MRSVRLRKNARIYPFIVRCSCESRLTSPYPGDLLMQRATNSRWETPLKIIMVRRHGECLPCLIGLYRENAIAIQNESGDPNGGNV